MDRETKQESSIPVQSRVSIVTLAALDNYWYSEGRDIRTVSQLVSWSLYLLSEILNANNMLDTEPSIEEARNHMMNRGLYQRNMDTRGYQKLGNAIKFQKMREEGGSPQQSTYPSERAAYSIMHRKPNRFTGAAMSVEPFTGKVDSNIPNREQIESIYNSLDEEVIRKKAIERSMGKDIDELPVFKERGNSPEDMQARIEANDRRAQEELDRLNNLDLAELLKNAKKE